jgi:nucleoside-diphosphate-sugar epimerase
MRTLPTEGSGFIGSHLAETFLERGCQVRVLDRGFQSPEEGLAETTEWQLLAIAVPYTSRLQSRTHRERWKELILSE